MHAIDVFTAHFLAIKYYCTYRNEIEKKNLMLFVVVQQLQKLASVHIGNIKRNRILVTYVSQ